MIGAITGLFVEPGASRAPSPEHPFTVDVVDTIDAGWDTLVAGFNDVCMEQTAAYMTSRWGQSRLCGLVLRGAMTGEPEAAALAVIAALPMVKFGMAYVKFGPLWRRRDRPARPSILASALTALREEFTCVRGLLTRVMPPAEPERGAAWTSGLAETGLRLRQSTADSNRYLVDLRLTEAEQLKSLGAKWRANLRKASPSLEVREEDPLRALPVFMGLYGAMNERKHFVDNHHAETLPAFLSAAATALSPRLFLAYADGRAVAGSIVVGSGERVFVPFSASSAEALPLRAGYALRWNLIGRLRETPARWLDLGGDGGDDGLRHFKSGNVGSRGRIVAIPGEYDYSGGFMSAAASTALNWAHGLARLRPLHRLAHLR